MLSCWLSPRLCSKLDLWSELSISGMPASSLSFFVQFFLETIRDLVFQLIHCPFRTQRYSAMSKPEYLILTDIPRGAQGSRSKTSWTGRAETDDLASFVGMMVYYLHGLAQSPHDIIPSPINDTSFGQKPTTPVKLVVGGYSYGSLILTRLPAVPSIIARFEDADRGTAAAEIQLRARKLASEERKARIAALPSPRGRSEIPQSPTARGSKHKGHLSTVYGGEETSPELRRPSREGKRSLELVRKEIETVPGRIRSAVRRHGSDKSISERRHGAVVSPIASEPRESLERSGSGSGPSVEVSYLLISPLLPPVSFALSLSLGTGSFMASKSTKNDLVNLADYSTLIIFGSQDMFASSRQVERWARNLRDQSYAKQKSTTGPSVQWLRVPDAGHFWREPGVEGQMRTRIAEWTEKVMT